MQNQLGNFKFCWSGNKWHIFCVLASISGNDSCHVLMWCYQRSDGRPECFVDWHCSNTMSDWLDGKTCVFYKPFLILLYISPLFILFYIFHFMLNHASAKCLHQILTYLISLSRKIWMFKPSTTVSFLTTSLFHKIIVFFKGIVCSRLQHLLPYSNSVSTQDRQLMELFIVFLS